jgi:hypothetical protein
MKPSSGGKTPDLNGHLRKPAVLSAFKKCASVAKACEIADICRDTFYRWLKEDPEFKTAYELRVKRRSRFLKTRQSVEHT